MKNNKSKRTKKILYLMHIDWQWVKQRPQFIAECLAEHYDVVVSYKNSFRKNNLSKSHPPKSVVLKKLYAFPFSRFNFISKLNKHFIRIQIAKIKSDADIIWLTHPLMYSFVMSRLDDEVLLIYDCMDDALEFPEAKKDKKKHELIRGLEEKLVERSNIIFCSSVYLKKKILSRYYCSGKVQVVNNALYISQSSNVNLSSGIPFSVSKFQEITGIKVLYVGTISSWFDFETIIEALDRFNKITCVLVGPCEIEFPKHDRLIVLPPVEHRYVADMMISSDALIMPFIVNELVKSVNPVKLYEYVYSLKPSLSVAYDETEPFDKYVYLYRDKVELFKFLDLLVLGKLHPKSSSDNAKKFVIDNTWDSRVREILVHIGNIN